MLDMDARVRVRNILKELDGSDGCLVRYLEDLVFVLIRKKVIDREDVPDPVVSKIKHRIALRKELAELREQLSGKP